MNKAEKAEKLMIKDTKHLLFFQIKDILCIPGKII